MDNVSLDPEDWSELRSQAHVLLDQSLDHLQNAHKGRVWTPLPEKMKTELSGDLPTTGLGYEQLTEKLASLLPYGVGNTHPRFFGWVHGAGSPGGMLPEIAAVAMNANLGGRDHGAIYVEKQVLEWCRQMMGFPRGSSGLIVSGTSMATIIALKCARDRALGLGTRGAGLGGARFVGYVSAQGHSCLARAFDLLGLGSDALRQVPCKPDHTMDMDALKNLLAHDLKAGFHPFTVIATAGSVNVGAIDDLDALAEFSRNNKLWLHIDGAFGATAVLSDQIRPRLKGMERADSIAFDFHKWLQVNYDAGCVLIRDGAQHLQSFSERPDYLSGGTRGLAAGNPWPVDYGPELSRGFRALKIWTHLQEHGTRKLGQTITRNCELARYLAQKVHELAGFEVLAPVTLNIVCFRATPKNCDDLDELNQQIVYELQETGVACTSTTRINGKLAIRVNITNHRTTSDDLDILLEACENIASARKG